MTTLKKKWVNAGAMESAFTTLKGYIDALEDRVSDLEKAVFPTDLTGTTWLFNEEISLLDDYSVGYYFNFTTDGIECTGVFCLLADQGNSLAYMRDHEYPFSAYTVENGWDDEAYRTISITGGEDASNPVIIKWLFLNATRVEEENNEDQLEA